LAACGVSGGCQRAVEPQFVRAELVSQLEPQLQEAVQKELHILRTCYRDFLSYS